MAKFILGKKVEMSQIFQEDGRIYPVTLVEAGPILVSLLRTKEKDGYDAVQVTYGRSKKEFRVPEGEEFKVGDTIDVSTFQEGDSVTISGITKGKGFQGVVKRHGFKGAPKTHGTKHAHRQPGSISGGGRAGGRVSKGLRMAGRMGGERVTYRNVKIVKVLADKNMLALKGALPGPKGSLVEIQGK